MRSSTNLCSMCFNTLEYTSDDSSFYDDSEEEIGTTSPIISANTMWFVREAYGEKECTRGELIPCNSVIRLGKSHALHHIYAYV